MSNAAYAPPPAAGNPAAQAPPRWVRIWQCIRRCASWESVVQFALVLWIVRVPLAMTVIGFLLLGKAPQAQDLFLEFARRSEWPTVLVTIDKPGLLVDIARRQIWRILLFVAILTVFWAMPTHYAARLLLDTDARFRALIAAQPDPQRACLLCMERCVPRLLGLATFVAVLVGIARSHANIPILDQKEVHRTLDLWLAILAVAVLIAAVAFYFYMRWRPRRAELPILRQIKSLNRRLAPVWRAVSPGLRAAPGSPDEASQDVGRFLFAAVFGVFLFIFCFGADAAAWLFPRAMAIPFILGGWMPFLGYLAGLGRQWRAPLIVGLFLATSTVTLVVGDNHSVRRIDARSAAGGAADTSRISLAAAVDLWMQENCNKTGAGCPRPIIVASSGGASRAGFFMSSVIGRLMFEAKSHGLTENDIRNRLFAISSVSGSSVGAVMVTAALDARTDAASTPCGERPVPQWWGVTVRNWQDCFEALTSGDFLTAVFFGFAFNDMLPFAWRDRAAVLEDTWSTRFKDVVTRSDAPADHPGCQGLECPFLTLRPRRGHWIPLLILNGTSEATGGRIVTTLLEPNYRGARPCPTLEGPNGCKLFTETDHFHDLIASKPDPRLDSWTGAIEQQFLRWLYRDARLDDVRLSTAAHNSARFPFISPPGTVRNGDQQVVDRIVDGGYFENYGAISANELALALRALRPELVPLVIVISNDPDDLLNPSDDSDPVAPPAVPRQAAQLSKARARVSGGEFVTDVTATITSFAHAWPAHGTLAVEDLRGWLHQTNMKCEIQLVHVRVWPQTEKPNETSSRAVSMSWWLSAPVQRHLHQQMEGDTNQNENEPRLDAIWRAMAMPGNCAAPAAQAR